jgi:tRNA-binding EMAP/Myf-like protein
MIRQMEVQLGKQHSASPFTSHFAAFDFSSAPKVEQPAQAVAVETVQKKENPKPAKNEKPEQKVQKNQEENKDAGAKKEKKPKEAKQPKQQAVVEKGPEVPEEFKQFVQADFRVGKIVECKPHPDSDKLYVEQIDLGEGRLRTIGSGL